MKGQEIMIGDFVCIANRFAKVHDIDKVIGVEFIDGRYDVFNPEEITPIPLTGDILEKNGFKLRENCTSAWDWDKGEISIQVSGLPDVFSRQTLTIYTSGGCVGAGFSTKRTLSDLSIHYVHELQHALRLCGINKEIVL